jgi:tRNASer (uridine44-2'-O)-methyltransferase
MRGRGDEGTSGDRPAPIFSRVSILMTKLRKDPKGWTPTILTQTDTLNDPPQGRLSQEWKYVIFNPACYSAEIFTQVNLELILHPERNTKNIRRADICSDSENDPDGLTDGGGEKERDIEGTVPGMVCVRTIRRRLMPRNPNLDAELEQTCRFYVVEGEESSTLVIYRNHFMEGEKVPYYIPGVEGIAFEWYHGNIYLAYLPLQGSPSIDERLNRIALHLLQTLHRHWYPSIVSRTNK